MRAVSRTTKNCSLQGTPRALQAAAFPPARLAALLTCISSPAEVWPGWGARSLSRSASSDQVKFCSANLSRVPQMPPVPCSERALWRRPSCVTHSSAVSSAILPANTPCPLQSGHRGDALVRACVLGVRTLHGLMRPLLPRPSPAQMGGAKREKPRCRNQICSFANVIGQISHQ